jgi:hypothetical protein
MLSPKRIAAEAFTDAAAAVARIADFYERNVGFLLLIQAGRAPWAYNARPPHFLAEDHEARLPSLLVFLRYASTSALVKIDQPQARPSRESNPNREAV